ncbi:MAG: sensor histidine kinase [Candidatus Heteroscillospira sp.]|jgi:signal transduction histidine kinase
MEKSAKKWRLPAPGWLSNRLTHKMLVILLVLLVLSCVLMCLSFLEYLGLYLQKSYDDAAAAAVSDAENLASFLEGSGGDTSGLDAYLSQHNFYCSIHEGAAEIYSRLPGAGGQSTLASGSATAYLPGGRVLDVVLWLNIQDTIMSSQLVRSALIGLSLLMAAILAVVAAAVYVLVLAPIIRLRGTMRRYYESGEQPERTERGDEIGRLQNTFADLAAIVSQKEQAERRLIASISHDIKTPLTSVLGYSERLRASELPADKQRRYLDSIYEKAVALKSLVDEFDEYLDVGLRDTAPFRLYTAGELCARLEKEYVDELNEAGVELSISCACPGDGLLCNWEHMRRFFGNLIGNSLQHCGAENIRLQLDCSRDGEELLFCFSDNGRGVPPQQLEQIFEPLYTSDRGRKVSGLGLSICRSIIKAHGGTVSACNTGGGFCILARLPIAKRG